MVSLRLLVCACFLALVSAFAPPVSAMHSCHAQMRAPTATIRMVTAATKPQRVNKRNREYNKKYKSEMRTRIKRVLEVVKDGDYAAAVPTLSKAFAIIDKNVKRNILHKNTAARKKSQLHLKVKMLESGGAAAAADVEA